MVAQKSPAMGPRYRRKLPPDDACGTLPVKYNARCWKARSRLMNPQPRSVAQSVLLDELIKIALIAEGAVTPVCLRSAAAPATCGAAMLVPVNAMKSGFDPETPPSQFHAVEKME